MENKILSDVQKNFRNAMATCAAGVHVVTTNGIAGRYGITMTAVASVTDEPPTILLCINRHASITPIITANRELCVNILSYEQQDIAKYFANMIHLTPEERFAHHVWEYGETNQLQVQGALAHLHGRVIDCHTIGTHNVFYVQIDKINVYDDNPALVYFRRSFKEII